MSCLNQGKRFKYTFDLTSCSRSFFLHFGRFSSLLNLIYRRSVAPHIFLSYHCLLSSHSLLPPALPSFLKSCTSLSPSSARCLIPVTRRPKVIWPTFLSAALWDIWALRPVFWRAICTPSSYLC